MSACMAHGERLFANQVRETKRSFSGASDARIPHTLLNRCDCGHSRTQIRASMASAEVVRAMEVCEKLCASDGSIHHTQLDVSISARDVSVHDTWWVFMCKLGLSADVTFRLHKRCEDLPFFVFHGWSPWCLCMRVGASRLILYIVGYGIASISERIGLCPSSSLSISMAFKSSCALKFTWPLLWHLRKDFQTWL